MKLVAVLLGVSKVVDIVTSSSSSARSLFRWSLSFSSNDDDDSEED
jgi:hypothetical protein